MVRIYQNINNEFTLFQTLTPSDGSFFSTSTGVITDDHQWVVFGTLNGSKVVDVYKFDGQEYKINQTLTFTYQIRSIDITQDHIYLAVGANGYDVYIYKHNGSQFNLLQTINFNTQSYNYNYVYISNDHKYLTVANRVSDTLYRFYFNEGSQEF